MEAEVYRLQGELLLRQADPDVPRVVACFQDALDIARSQGAKSLELRAAISLSPLYLQQGKRRKAHELLTPVYKWFTEGFGTANLMNTSELLAQLA